MSGPHDYSGNDLRARRISRERGQFDGYLVALGIGHVDDRVQHQNRRWTSYRLFACGCMVPVGYPLYREIIPCRRHTKALGNCGGSRAGRRSGQ